MEARKIAVKLKRDPRETAERHSQANPLTLECTLASGEAVTETMELRAELHAAQTPQTTPLAATAAVTMTTGSEGPWELEFTGAQMNQAVLPDASEDFWVIVYATGANDKLLSLGKLTLTLTFDNISQTTPPPPDPALFLDLGGTQWKLGENYLIDDIVALDGSIYVCTADNTSSTGDEPGVGQEWESFWTLFSGGGGGGATNLGIGANSPTTVTITSSTGTSAVIPSATGSVAGVMSAADSTKLAGIQAGAEVNVNADWNAVSGDAAILNKPTITNGTVTTVSVTTANGVSGSVANATTTPAITLTLGAITPTSVNGVTIANGGSGALTVSGTASVSGTNTGNVTLAGQNYITIAGQVITAAQINLASHVTGDLPLANLAQASAASRLLGRGSASGAGDYQEISLGSGLSMSGTTLSATATGGGTNTILQFFPKDAEFPSTGFATIDTRNNHPCLDFADSGTETAFFTGFIPQGATFADSGTALTVVLESTATSATTGNIGWSVALERIVAGGIDIDADAFGTAQSSSTAVSGTSGVVSEVSVTFTKAQLPTSLAAGDQIRVRVQRNTAVSGNHSGDAELLGLYANMTPNTP